MTQPPPQPIPGQQPIRPYQPPPGYQPAGYQPLGYQAPGYQAPGYQPTPTTGYAVPGGPPGYPAPVYRRPGPTAPSGAPLAEFWERLVAYLLDGVIIGAVLLIPYVIGGIIIFSRFLDAARTSSQSGTVINMNGFLVGYLIFFVGVTVLQMVARFFYDAVYQARKGQTVGKRVMKIRVERVDGTPFDMRSATTRWFLQYVLAFVPVYSWINGLWQLWDQPYRQCLHDKGAKTVVVKVVV